MKLLPDIIELKRAGDLLRGIDAYGEQPATGRALRLLPHLFLRPGELRKADWSEIDLDAAVWRVLPADEDAAGPYRAALPTVFGNFDQALKLFGHGRLVFPAPGRRDLRFSENTVTSAIQRMCFSA